MSNLRERALGALRENREAAQAEVERRERERQYNAHGRLRNWLEHLGIESGINDLISVVLYDDNPGWEAHATIDGVRIWVTNGADGAHVADVEIECACCKVKVQTRIHWNSALVSLGELLENPYCPDCRRAY